MNTAPTLLAAPSRLAPWLAAITLPALAMACGSAGPAWVDDAWLDPGRTTVENLRAAEAQSADTPPPTDLHSAIAQLLATSPTLVASSARARAALARVPQASSLPRPELTLGAMTEPSGAETQRLQLMQALPFPTRLVAAHDAAHALATAALAAHDRAARDEITRLSRAWAERTYTARALAVATAHESLARALSEAASARHASGRGTLFDLAKAEAELAQLGYDRLRLAEQLTALDAAVNAALGRPPRAPLPPAPPLPDRRPTLDEDALLATALAHQQELRELDAALRAADAHTLAAASAWWPDLGVELQLLRSDMGLPTDAGAGPREGYGVMVRLSLPVWLGDQAAQLAEARAERTAARAAKRAHLDRLRADLAGAVFTARNARRLLTLYDQELLPQAARALATAEQWSAADVTHFSDFLEARAVAYGFALARERAAADHFLAVVALEALVGAPLPEEAP